MSPGAPFKAWISNYIHYKVWAQITDPYPNFNSATHTLLGMWVFIHAAIEVNWLIDVERLIYASVN